MNETIAVNGSTYMELTQELRQTQEDLKDAQAYIGLTLENLASQDRRRRKHFQDLEQLKQAYRTTGFRLSRVRQLLQGMEPMDLRYLEQGLRQHNLQNEGARSFRNRANRRKGLAQRLRLQTQEV